MDSLSLVLYGFVRHLPQSKNSPAMQTLQGTPTYIYVPKQRYEDRPDLISPEELRQAYPTLDIRRCVTWDYDKQIFAQKVPKGVPPFNCYYQQPYRIYSCFYHIKQALSLLPDGLDPDHIIILSRIDIDIQAIDLSTITELLKFPTQHDLIVEAPMDTPRTYVDRVFIFKARHIPVFQRLYNDFTQYLLEFHFPTKKSVTHQKIKTWRPEEIYGLHFDYHQLSIAIRPVVSYQHQHICSPYCGHNGPATVRPSKTTEDQEHCS